VPVAFVQAAEIYSHYKARMSITTETYSILMDNLQMDNLQMVSGANLVILMSASRSYKKCKYSQLAATSQSVMKGLTWATQ
jgi:hypothetical protein